MKLRFMPRLIALLLTAAMVLSVPVSAAQGRYALSSASAFAEPEEGPVAPVEDTEADVAADPDLIAAPDISADPSTTVDPAASEPDLLPEAEEDIRSEAEEDVKSEAEEDPLPEPDTDVESEAEDAPLPEPDPAPKPLSEWTDQEIIDAYDIPNDWSRDPLIFAVRTGILTGRGDEGLCPRATATRAEMAAMLMYILGTEAKADISAFQDLKPGSWYYDILARAVALQLLSGTSETTMAPNAPVTREMAFTILAKAFGITGRGRKNIYNFLDWADVSEWAAVPVSAIVESCQLVGSDGRLNPKGLITRRELAQLFYRLVNGFGKTLAETSRDGCYVLNAKSIPAGTVIEGDLMLASDSSRLVLDRVTVTGRLILQGRSAVTVTMTNCQIHELVTCRGCTLTTGGGVNTLTVLARTVLLDHVDRAEVYAILIIQDDASVGTVNINADEISVPLNGTVGTINVYGKNCKVGGKGRTEKLNVYGEGLSVWCEVGSKTEQIVPGLAAINAQRTDAGEASPKSPKLNIGLNLTKLPPLPRGGRLTWYVNDKKISSETRLLSNNMTTGISMDFTAEINAEIPQVPVRFVLESEGETFVYNGTVDLSAWIREEAATIRTQGVQAKLKYATSLYNDYNVYSKQFSGKGQTVAAGTVVTILKTSKSTGARVRLPSGTVGWLSYSALSIYTGNYYTTSDYSRQAKEYYVNTVKGYSSSTQYLIWISLYTQRVNVFQGSKGNWKLVKCFPCSSGRNTCPTPVVSVKVLRRSPKWYFDGYYVHHVTIFDESRAFHSRPYYNNGTVKDYAMGYPASDGCVRMLDDDCTWIHQNIPDGTAIEIY